MTADDQILAEILRRLLEDEDTSYTLSDGRLRIDGAITLRRHSEYEALDRVVDDQR